MANTVVRLGAFADNAQEPRLQQFVGFLVWPPLKLNFMHMANVDEFADIRRRRKLLPSELRNAFRIY